MHRLSVLAVVCALVLAVTAADDSLSSCTSLLGSTALVDSYTTQLFDQADTITYVGYFTAPPVTTGFASYVFVAEMPDQGGPFVHYDQCRGLRRVQH